MLYRLRAQAVWCLSRKNRLDHFVTVAKSDHYFIGLNFPIWANTKLITFAWCLLDIVLSHEAKGAFTQSVLRGVICRRLGYLINKKCFFTYKTTILRGVFCPNVNAT